MSREFQNLFCPGETGWLVPAGDDAALASAIEALAETPADVLNQMGRDGRARALARHDISNEADKLLRNIQDIHPDLTDR